METVGDEIAQFELNLAAMEAASQRFSDALEELIHVAASEQIAPTLNIDLGNRCCGSINFALIELAQAKSHLVNQKLHRFT